MITRQHRQSRLKRLWMPLVTVAFLGYFGFHAFHGYYGIWAMDRLEIEAKRLSVQLASLQREHADFERRVMLLRSEKLDADMVDVQARSALNRIRADEVVIRMTAPQQKLQ
jgi:cell division protein FtsB